MIAKTTTNDSYLNHVDCPGIAIKSRAGPYRKPRQVVACPNLSSRSDYGAHNNDLPNLLRALVERVFNVEETVLSDGARVKTGKLVPTPQPQRGAWRSLDCVAKRIADRVNKVGRLSPMTCSQFVDQCPANKKALYARAASQYEKEGVRERDCRIKAFVKFEKIDFTTKGDPAPRIIQPRSPVYNIALGRYTRRIEHDVYRALAEEWGGEVDCGLHHHLVVMKGLTVTGIASALRAKWLRVHDPVAISIDASRFDQHVSDGALLFEHSIYNRLFGYDKELLWLLSKQRNNRGCASLDGKKITYCIKGTRASGDMNTSLGNCIIMCTLVREYIRELGIKAEFANNGDDCVLIVSRRDSHLLTGPTSGFYNWFLRFGFEMTVDGVASVFEHIKFCQTQPVLVDAGSDEWVMVRQPRVAMGKDALCLNCRTERQYRQWSYQVGVGGHALYGDMPIFCELYAAYRREGIRSNMVNSLTISDSGFIRMSKVPRVRSTDSVHISDDTRISFFKAFGYPPSVQIEMERGLQVEGYEGLRFARANVALGWGQFSI